MTVVFAGGGTGGHLYPAIAVADALRRRGARIAFVGSADRLEKHIVPAADYVLHTIASHALPRRPSLRTIRAATSNLIGIVQSLRILARVRPDLVIATGGYVCFPVALAARIRRSAGLSRARIVLLEANVSPGLTTRLLSGIVDEIWGECGGFSRAARAKCRPTGVPVRYRAESLPPRSEAATRLGLDPLLQTVLGLGGSQGAHSINEAFLRVVRARELPSGWQILLVTGSADYDRVREHAAGTKGFVVVPYLDTMADAYAAADVVVARAGASTLAELNALRKPAILIPYPHATENHQAENAQRVVATGRAVTIRDSELPDGRLGVVLADVLVPSRLAELAGGASETVADDSLDRILARVDTLVRGKSEP